MKVTVGSKAPDFELPDSDKKMHKLSDYKGKNVVLLFFPAAFTGVCTKEMCQSRDDLSFYNNMNAVVLGVSVDMPFTLAKFKELNNLNFTLLSDFNKEAITAYGVKYDNWSVGLKGVAKRSVFVIDKEGVVRHAEILENAGDYPNFDAVKKALEGIAEPVK
ncbi:MAG: peroxiredoxin [Bacteroidota bacterium]